MWLWSCLSREVVESPSLQIFTTHLDMQPAVGDPALARGWTGRSTEVPSNPCHAGILWCARIASPLSPAAAIRLHKSQQAAPCSLCSPSQLHVCVFRTVWEEMQDVRQTSLTSAHFGMKCKGIQKVTEPPRLPRVTPTITCPKARGCGLFLTITCKLEIPC